MKAAQPIRRVPLLLSLAAAAFHVACDAGPPPGASPPDAVGEPAITGGPAIAGDTAPAIGADEEPREWESPQARAIWENARERGVHFRAIGQEPGWVLEITDGEQIEFVGDYGDWRVVTPAPPPETPGPEDRTYYRIRTDAHTVDITIDPFECFDTMSGEPFPAAVEVIVDGRTFHGCGRALR